MKKIDNELYPTVFIRKSTRKYSNDVITEDVLEKLQLFIKKTVPLFTSEKVSFEIQHHKNNIMKIAAYSKKNTISLINTAFMLQQIDLYIQTIGLGSYWNTTVKATKGESQNLPYAICLLFGPAKDSPTRMNTDKIKRKRYKEITNNPDLPFIEAARIAPSSRNRQPYYLFCRERSIDFYYKRVGILDNTLLRNLHWFDIGICICNVVIALQQESYLPEISIKSNAQVINDLIYSVSLNY